MVSGQTINVAVNPLGAKQLLPAETFVPGHLELRNGLRTDGGFFRQRPGYQRKWTMDDQQPITLLIPKPRTARDIGFAVTENGKVYELHRDLTASLMAGSTLNGVFRPTWAEFDGVPIVTDGQAPVKIDPAGTTTSLLGGDPPAAKYIAVLADHVILSGYDDTGFSWSNPGNAEMWPAENVSSVTGHGEKIRFMQEKDTDLYFFKDYSIEIWSHIGGIEVFGRRGIVTFADKHNCRRPLASFSCVLARGVWHWYANGDFWRLNNFSPEAISGTFKRELETIRTTEDCYGFDFQKEHVIRWFFPTEGRCLVYDYLNGTMTEDNAWIHGAFARLPIFAYMEVEDRAYIGDYDPTGNVSEWSSDYHDDDGRPIRLTREFTVPLNAEGRRASVNRCRIRMERGNGVQMTHPAILARWKFDSDHYGPYSPVSLGEFGDHDPYIDVVNAIGGKVLGKGRDLTMELIQTAPVPHVMTHCNLTVQPLGN